MKKHTRIISILLAVALLLCAAPQISLTANATAQTGSEPLYYGKQVLSRMSNSANLLFAYEQLAAGVANAKSSITMYDSTHFISAKDVSTVMTAMRSDHPEYFWLSSGYSYSENSSGKLIQVSPGYTMTGATLTQAKADLEAAVQSFLTGLDNKTDYQKSKLLHDRLAAHMSYESTSNDQNIYGALVEKQAVCAGYAAAYQYLLQRTGIPAWYVTGSSINPTTGQPEGHAWTLSCLDGNWYHSDITWDDQGNLGNILYAYLNVTTAQIEADHQLDPFFKENLPQCTATANNYFIQSGSTISVFDTDTVANALKANNLRARFWVTGDKQSFKNAWAANIRAVVQKLGISGQLQYGCSTIGNSNEIILYIINGSADAAPAAITLSALPKKLVYSSGEALDLTGGTIQIHYNNDTVKVVSMNAAVISGYDKYSAGRQVLTVTAEGCTEYFTVTVTGNSGETPPVQEVVGDYTGDGEITNEDVIHLLWFTVFPEDYPINGKADFTGDGEITNEDVIHLLWFTVFPEDYPLS